MKTLAILVAFATLAFNAEAQELLAQAKSGDDWGYINTKGEFVIKAQYSNCHAFSEGLAPIYDKKAKTFYFIKPDGSQLSTDIDKFKLKNIFGFGTVGFSEGMVPVEVGKRWGYLNSKGIMSVEAKYDKASEFNDGRGVVKLGNSFFLVDVNGKETKVDIPGVEDVKRFSSGLAPFKANGLWGFIGTDGQVICKAQFKGIGYMSPDGLAWAKNEAGKVGFITETGNSKSDFSYDAAKNFSDGLSETRKGDVTIFVSAKGTEVSPVKADSYGSFSEGLAYAKTNGKVGFIGTDGKWVIDAQFDAVRDFKNGMAAAKQGDLWGFIDKKGGWVIKPEFNAVKDFETTSK